MKILGPDISFYQDDDNTVQGVNFEAMKNAGARFVLVRVGQSTWGDSDFKINWKNAKAAGLPRGSYWFFDSRTDPKIQAKKCIEMFEGDFGELPLFADFEDTYGGKFGRWNDWYNFMEALKALQPGIRLGVYTGYYYFRERTLGEAIPTGSLKYFKQYPLWIAAYNPVGPLIPVPWTEHTLWQFTDKGDGTLYGVESMNIDLNYFNGDETAFAEFAQSPTPVETPAEEQKPMQPTIETMTIVMSDKNIIHLKKQE